MTRISMVRLILYVRDVARLQSFYETYFGFSLVQEIPGEWAVLTDGGFELALHLVGQAWRNVPLTPGSSNAKLVFSVGPGLPELRSRLENAGVPMGEIQRYSRFACSVCDGRDPEGNVFQLSQAD